MQELWFVIVCKASVLVVVVVFVVVVFSLLTTAFTHTNTHKNIMKK